MRGSRIAGISRRALLAALAGCLLTWGARVLAEPMQKPVLIGALTSSWGPTPEIAGLVEGLKKLSYREDEDFVLGVRFTKGNRETLPGAARDLVRDGAQILFAVADDVLESARTVTGAIPIVFVSLAVDPVRAGFIQSFARPGGRITGLVGAYAALGPKRLQILREMVPGLKRVLFPYFSRDKSTAELDPYEIAAKRINIEFVGRSVRSPEELRDLLENLESRVGTGLISPIALELDIPGQLLEAGRKHRIPTMFYSAWYVEQGGLASYGPSFYAAGVHAARLVDKIIRGEDPGSIPVEVMSDIELVINLKTAKALGLEIPREVLYQANRIIR